MRAIRSDSHRGQRSHAVPFALTFGVQIFRSQPWPHACARVAVVVKAHHGRGCMCWVTTACPTHMFHKWEQLCSKLQGTVSTRKHTNQQSQHPVRKSQPLILAGQRVWRQPNMGIAQGLCACFALGGSFTPRIIKRATGTQTHCTCHVQPCQESTSVLACAGLMYWAQS